MVETALLDLPCWSNACQSILLMQPSSAAVERLFSLLTNSFSDEQRRSLEDYIIAVQCIIVNLYLVII